MGTAAEAPSRERASALWLRRNGVVLAAGVAAALPVIVSTVHAVAAGWLPIGDDAVVAIRAYDTLSTHPPLVGSYSSTSQLIGAPVYSPGPLLYWLLAVPVRLGAVAPAVTAGLVNTAAIVWIVALARRRGGPVFMFATAAVLAAACGSLDSRILHDVFTPHIVILPFTLLIFLAWSLACGEYRLLPVTVLVASFAVQAHLAYLIPTVALLAVAGVFLATSGRTVPRAWLVGALVVAIACWSFPLVEQAIHRPGNIVRIARVAAKHQPRLGAAAGWHTIAHTVGIPPWWLRSPRHLSRYTEVRQAPGALTTATAALMLLALAGVAVAALRARRRELAAAASIALVLLLALGVVTATNPSEVPYLLVIGYTTWWASFGGAFAWLVLGLAAGALVPATRRLRPVRAATAAAVGAVVAVGVTVAAAQEVDPLEHTFRPYRRIADRVRDTAPARGTVLVAGQAKLGWNLQSAVAYALRVEGASFLISGFPGTGGVYDPGGRRYSARFDVVDSLAAGPPGGRVVARVRRGDVTPTAAPVPVDQPVFVILARAEP